ncbi:MAG: DUF4388 domain-containing protein [Candidatus Sumerlaeia bacterium]|nr:DUF4388 domain-containing protein [Candidatus Sumerlaeia bacterium]
MPHRSLTSLVFAGLEPSTSATVISMLGDDGLPTEIRLLHDLAQEPWHVSRTGLLVIGMNPETDLSRVSHLIQNRTTWWEVVVCLVDVLAAYEVALLAQGAAKVLRHPQEDLEGCANQLKMLLKSMNNLHTDAFGLEVSDLIQLFGEKRLDKTVRLTGKGTIGSIYMRGGNVIHAETIDEIYGMDAFRILFSIASPEIRVHKGCLTTKSTINLPAMSCLLEGSRVLDESAGMASGELMRPPDEMDVESAFHALDDELEGIEGYEDMEPIRPSKQVPTIQPAIPPKPTAPPPASKAPPKPPTQEHGINDSIFDELDFGEHNHTPPPAAPVPAAAVPEPDSNTPRKPRVQRT